MQQRGQAVHACTGTHAMSAWAVFWNAVAIAIARCHRYGNKHIVNSGAPGHPFTSWTQQRTGGAAACEVRTEPRGQSQGAQVPAQPRAQARPGKALLPALAQRAHHAGERRRVQLDHHSPRLRRPDPSAYLRQGVQRSPADHEDGTD